MWLCLTYYYDEGDELEYFDKNTAQDVEVMYCDTEKEAIVAAIGLLSGYCSRCDLYGYLDKLNKKLWGRDAQSYIDEYVGLISMEKELKELALSKMDVCRSDIEELVNFLKDNSDLPEQHYLIEDKGDLPLVMSDYVLLSSSLSSLSSSSESES